MGVAADERQALSALLDELGPDQPTLCEGWRTRDLAAHLVLREHRPDAAAGIVVPALASYTKKVQDGYAAKPWAELVAQVRSGPAWYWPTRVGPLDELANGAEFLVHHEDVRRGQPNWEPRRSDPARDATAWRSVKAMAKLSLRRSPAGVVLRTDTGEEVTAKAGNPAVTVVGAPVELLLFTFGRNAVRAEFEGDPDDVAKLAALSRGL
ncbi:TIGR03085 family metal-binding protein [Amycolatopsis sp.]|uniref:TIGR03085 family metal-binding protein n=1 Tax=Amycolatopsis sp. TaxID=37632 RepID=UPI002BE78759|nr:TIGR03085 family metal-binding protein [Amycolatopsis sp.]HVV07899.1 TIGR03085 family metal-binding protein [Amycolatopsis sp.]